MIIAACILGLIFGLVRGGRLKSILRKKFRLPLLLLAALACNLAWSTSFADNIPLISGQTARIILAVVQALFMSGFLYINRKKPGMILLLAGSLANSLVIIANRGQMPIGPYVEKFGDEALAKIAQAPNYFLAAGGEPLLFLADIFPFWTFGYYMVSLGDFIISIGIFLLAAYLSKRVLRPGNPARLNNSGRSRTA